MAKLKNTPVALSVINVVSALSVIVAAVGIIGVFVSILDGWKNIEQTLPAAISGIVLFALFGGLYHIVKAACIYIEKEENPS